MAFLFLLAVAAAPRPHTEVAVRVNTPDLAIEHQEAMAQEVSRALNRSNIRVTVIMSDRVIGVGPHATFDKGAPTASEIRLARSGMRRAPSGPSIAIRNQKPRSAS
jgi:hypothetical protein